MGRNLDDPKSMDGPSVKFTLGDMLQSHPKFFLTYHVMDAGYDVLTPLGVMLGGAAFYGLGYKPHPTPLATMGSAGLVAGSAGILLGATRLCATALKGNRASPPWNQDGIQQRVDGLSHNFHIRVMENSVFLGAGVAAACVYAAGGPGKLGLSNGALGVAQAVSLGSAAGTVSAMACIACNK